MIYGRLSEKLPAFSPLAGKQSKKIYVPVKEYTRYNFIGIIMGPRGNTHKEMEQKTGASIKLRGRGTHKLSKKTNPSDKE